MEKINTIFISGIFNVLHPGHQRIIKFAHELADNLVVGVYSDRKAGDKAIISEEYRIEGLKNNIYIQLKGEIYKLEKEKWEKFNYKISGNKIIPSVSATFIQYPLKLAWAATIHKCQGQTFENVIIDMDYGAFAHGQTYVALSRVVSLKGLYLRRALTKNDFIFNQEIQGFLN